MSEVLSTINIIANLMFLLLFFNFNYTVFPDEVVQEMKTAATEIPEKKIRNERKYCSPLMLGIVCVLWSISMMCIRIAVDTTIALDVLTLINPLLVWFPLTPFMLMAIGFVIRRKIETRAN
jgi:hypothetical protein